MDYIVLIQKTIDYIDENIQEKINADDFAYILGVGVDNYNLATEDMYKL